MTLATNKFPMPANLRPVQPPEPKPVPSAPVNLAQAFRSFAGQESFRLDPDLKLALEDQCSAALGSQWREGWSTWLNEMVNESIRAYLGR